MHTSGGRPQGGEISRGGLSSRGRLGFVTADLPWLGLRPSLIAAGYRDGELRRLRRTGELDTVRRGAYVSTADPRVEDELVRHRLLIMAGLGSLAPGAVVSHCSAAVLLGLPLWSIPLNRLHVTRSQRTGGRLSRTVHLHTAPLAGDDVVEIDGIAVTSPARTVVDLARSVPFEAAVVTADGALREGLMPGALAGMVERVSGWRGAAAARRVVAFADGRSESVGESRSRVAILRAGLPAPVPQWEVWRGAAVLARCDFGWPELRTVGEFDGRVKYGRLLSPDQYPGDVVFDEKLREDELRAEGLHVARWTWRDLTAFAGAAARIRRGPLW